MRTYLEHLIWKNALFGRYFRLFSDKNMPPAILVKNAFMLIFNLRVHICLASLQWFMAARSFVI